MNRPSIARLGWAIAGTLALQVVAATAAASNDGRTGEQRSLPPFSTVERLVDEYYASKTIQSNDLLSQGDVKPVFAILAQHGWDVADKDQILKLVPGDKSWLVRTLRTPRGKTLARDTSRFPGGLDRLDRLSRLPHGHTFIEGLMSGPDGYKLFEYMTQTPGGKVLGRQVEHAPKGRNFNEPTGRIYTPEDLITRLRQSYDAAAELASQRNPG